MMLWERRPGAMRPGFGCSHEDVVLSPRGRGSHPILKPQASSRLPIRRAGGLAEGLQALLPLRLGGL